MTPLFTMQRDAFICLAEGVGRGLTLRRGHLGFHRLFRKKAAKNESSGMMARLRSANHCAN